MPKCADCELPYTDLGFADLVVSNEVWKQIAPSGDGNGLLCPTCICRAAARLGLVDPTAKFRSGPFTSHSEPSLPDTNPSIDP